MMVGRVLFFIILSITKIECASDCTNVILECTEETDCQSCLRKSPCCDWCYQPDYHGDRCNVRSQLSVTCNKEYTLENEESGWSALKNVSFSSHSSKMDAVQLRPQMIEVRMRSGETVELEFRYQAAKNYPLELYYLMDLSRSMRSDLETIKALGTNLTKILSTMTKYYKIGFGSYVEKTEMPFYLMDPESQKNPCRYNQFQKLEQCEPGYAFKHKFDFGDVKGFIDVIEKSQVSANLDNLESGFDALMQILLCHEEIGWTDNSRKLVLIATESFMHMAGDGLLAGATKRNIEQCLIDSNGNYLDSLTYDYPSLEEIQYILNRRKINLIFAIKDSAWDYYKQVQTLIPEASFLGKLEKGSKNIMGLIKEGYNTFIKNAKFSINTSDVDNLDVKFYARCTNRQQFEERDNCDNIKEGKSVVFKVQLKKNKLANRTRDILHIEEKNIHEKIDVELRYIDAKCHDKCQNAEVLKCAHGGKSVCGACLCEDDWSGPLCTVPCESQSDSCSQFDNGTRTSICFRRGDCTCGKCDCHFPYAGKLCEYACPHGNGLRCSGHGKCSKWGCKCDVQYTGENCDCSVAQDNCKIPGASIVCNGHGKCECNRCKCEEGYGGAFCEQCDNCEGFCNVYSPCIVKRMQGDEEPVDTCMVENVEVLVEKTDEISDNQQKCIYQYYQDGGVKCQTEYTYVLEKQVSIRYMEPQCDRPMPASMQIGLGLLVVFIPGIAAIVFFKMRNWLQDKREYSRFVEQQKRGGGTHEMNPLYKSPVSQYTNPMAQTSRNNY